MIDKEHITIHGRFFLRPVKYMEGHVCTEGDAKALDKNMADKFRLYWGSKVKADQRPDKEIQVEMDRWVGNFQHGTRSGVAARDPLISTVIHIVQEMQTGKKFKDGGSAIKAAKKLIAKSPEIVKLAQRRLREAAELAAADLQSMIDG